MLAVAAAEVSEYMWHIIFSLLMERSSATLQDSLFPGVIGSGCCVM